MVPDLLAQRVALLGVLSEDGKVDRPSLLSSEGLLLLYRCLLPLLFQVPLKGRDTVFLNLGEGILLLHSLHYCLRLIIGIILLEVRRRHDILKLMTSLLLCCDDLYVGLLCHYLTLSLLRVHEMVLLVGV